MRWSGLIVVTLLAACGARPLAPAPDAFVPPFARAPYEPFSRQSVVAIALREWRLFGQPVDDAPPDMRPPPIPEQMPERETGLWQRVGEYWWLGMNSGVKESAYTGKHDASGAVFSANVDASYAWSAAFVSYVMRIAGAGPRFPYSPNHAHYINVAKQMALGETHGWLITAERPDAYGPQQGDLICAGRDRAASLTYANLPAGQFPAHCAIVVDTSVAGQISVIAGNVDDAVTLTHVPVTPDGKLAGPDGRILDTRYPWMVVLRLLVGVPPVA